MWLAILFTIYSAITILALAFWSRKARMTCLKCDVDLGMADEWKVCAPCALRSTDGE